MRWGNSVFHKCPSTKDYRILEFNPKKPPWYDPAHSNCNIICQSCFKQYSYLARKYWEKQYNIKFDIMLGENSFTQLKLLEIFEEAKGK